MAQGKIRDAIEMFQKVVNLDPQHMEAYNNLAILQKDIGHANEVRNHLFVAFILVFYSQCNLMKSVCKLVHNVDIQRIIISWV